MRSTGHLRHLTRLWRISRYIWPSGGVRHRWHPSVHCGWHSWRAHRRILVGCGHIWSHGGHSTGCGISWLARVLLRLLLTGLRRILGDRCLLWRLWRLLLILLSLLRWISVRRHSGHRRHCLAHRGHHRLPRSRRTCRWYGGLLLRWYGTRPHRRHSRLARRGLLMPVRQTEILHRRPNWRPC